MFVYVLQRLAYILLILVVMSLLIFFMTQVMPGNVANMIAGQFASPEVIAALEDKLHLHDPLWVQYGRWAASLLHGNFGDSLIMERPIAPLIAEALARSAILAGLSFVCVAILGVALGVLAAVHHNSTLDHGVSLFTYLGISVPEFFWGIVLILAFTQSLHWLPSGGYVPFAEDPGKWLSHLILPAATLTFTLIAHVSRLTRASMLETLRSQYVRNARAKGLPERVILTRYALRNALLPTITILAVDIGWLIGGVVVVETVFSFPGLGRLLMFAVERRDVPLIQASILVVTLIYCVSNLVADLLYAYFNPRIRYGRAAA